MGDDDSNNNYNDNDDWKKNSRKPWTVEALASYPEQLRIQVWEETVLQVWSVRILAARNTLQQKLELQLLLALETQALVLLFPTLLSNLLSSAMMRIIKHLEFTVCVQRISQAFLLPGCLQVFYDFTVKLWPDLWVSLRACPTQHFSGMTVSGKGIFPFSLSPNKADSPLWDELSQGVPSTIDCWQHL